MPPAPPWCADEASVAQQLRMLTAPHGAVRKNTPRTNVRPQTPDPQLVYEPPERITSYGEKAQADARVSAASFNKKESPLQAVVATVGSMAILLALYHFGYFQGSQAQQSESSNGFASVASPPAMPVAPDPFEVANEAGPAIESPPVDVGPIETPAPETPLVGPPKPTPIAATPVAQASPTPAEPSGLYLQAAAVRDSSSAEVLGAKLWSSGFSVEVLPASEDGLTRVLAGPYADMDAARQAAAQMKSLGVEAFPKRF